MAKNKRIVVKERLLKAVFPIKNIILFESNPDFSDNTYWLFRYISQNSLFMNFKLVWLISDTSHVQKSLCNRKIICVNRFTKSYIDRLKRFYYLQTAKIIIDCNRTVYKSREKQIRVYLGHGMPIKSGKGLFDNRAFGECDVLPVMGEGFIKIYNRFGYQHELRVCGYPRNEILSSVQPNKENRYIIWMPTFREHAVKEFAFSGYRSEFPLGIPVIKSNDDLGCLNEYLKKKRIKMFIRLHPAQDLSLLHLTNMEYITIADDAYLTKNNATLYEFIGRAAALITDYSSVYYDFLLTKRPIGLTFEDAENYEAKFGLCFSNIREELPGFQINKLEDMKSFIDEISNGKDSYYNSREDFCSGWGIKMMASSKIISDYLIKRIGH